MAQPTDLGKYNNQRYHCKFCNTYCLNNASQVDKHNNGNRHRRAVENYLKQNRKAKQRESAEERKLEKELSSIARAANAAMGSTPGGVKITGFVPAAGKEDHAAWKKRRAAKDAQDADKYSRSNYTTDGETPYGPSDGADGGGDDGDDDDDDDDVGGDVVPEIPGHYAIGDDWFLEGTLYEHLLAPLAEVQVYVEELDDWADGIVLSMTPPGAECAAEVEYVTPAGDMVTISGVASEDLRLRATAAGELLAMEEAVDEDTGLGGWTTVSEVVVDDAVVAAAQAMEEAEAREERKGNPNSKRPAATLDDGERDEDVENALSFYSEGGGGGGGMPVDNAGRIELESHAIAGGAKVGFKKRNKKASVTRVKEEE